ncbi:ABC transporter substrate-binding protein [Micromonospora olivasterospora]|uniref:Peptide/nickel transport system substrate-binding protein n=1 Tax=Micromonospora olivasterospora TaxID=1880 RepID=A0A562IJI8_MICOL|nr:ABC transporter substrate-binding protein [Micromonospora olivasterospora]TWH71090.1 peptide/nickel transport system substrate-binding protein [Micromonospora olivasterospora]
MNRSFPSPFAGAAIDRRRFLQLGALLGAGATIAACAPGGSAGTSAASAPTKAVSGGKMTVGLPTPSGPVDPVTMNDIGAVDTVLVAAEYLTFPRADGSLEGRLATTWTADDASTWTFTLRQGVKFHDGSELTAADVVATFDRVTDPDGGSAGLQSFAGILAPGGTTAVDDHTVRFKLDRPYADFPYLVSAYAYNTAILPASYRTGDFVKGGFGTGPYILTRFIPGSGAVFRRNENYWLDEAAYLDTLEVKYFADTNAQVLAVQSASVDLVPSVEPATLRTLKRSTNIVLQEAASSSFQSLQMRTDVAPFNDKRVRQALALCLDRTKLIAGLIDGKASLGNDHLFAPTFESAESVAQAVEQRNRDIAAAKRLLSEAGHPNGLDVTLTTTRIFECVDHATLVKDMAADAGFRITLDIMTPEEYFASGDNSPWLTVPLGITNWGSRGCASQVLEATVATTAPYNSAHFSNAELDNLIKKYDAEPDAKARAGIAASIAELLHEEVPIIVSYFKSQVRVATSRVGGMPAGPGDFPDFQKVFVSA